MSTRGSASCPRGAHNNSGCVDLVIRLFNSTLLCHYRFADEDDDVIFADYDAGYVSPNDGYIPRPATTRKHTDAQGKLTIDRGTQTITRVRQVTDPSAYRAQKPEFFEMASHEEDQVCSFRAWLYLLAVTLLI